MKYDIIIIGAGAAGLMAMKDLLKCGYRVCMLEATTVAGGRIASINENGFHSAIETGAEFVHGNLPLTLELLNAAAIRYESVEGEMITAKNGKWEKNQAHDSHWKQFMEQLSRLQIDTSMQQFLKDNFSGYQFKELRQAVKNFAEGFDLADISIASTFALRDEWNLEESEQYRIPGGYSQLICFLLQECDLPSATIFFNAPVRKIEYNASSVLVYTNSGQVFSAEKLIVTVSAGILQSGQINFFPALDMDYQRAIQHLGFGNVIKVIIQFKTAFWKNHSTDIGFLFSNETIPTWWTQTPLEKNILTGWLGGPSTIEMARQTTGAIFQSSLQSLAAIFNVSLAELQEQVNAYKIIDWQRKEFIKGGYSYNTTRSVVARQKLSVPVENKIYFAGEALYEGVWQGTVEAALQNGKDVAQQLKASFGKK